MIKSISWAASLSVAQEKTKLVSKRTIKEITEKVQKMIR